MATNSDGARAPGLIPMSDFVPPPAQVSEAAKRGTVAVLRQLKRINDVLRRRSSDADSEKPPEREVLSEQLLPLSCADFLARKVRPELEAWFASHSPDGDRPRILTVVGPPFSGVCESSEIVANDMEFEPIEPPDLASFLDHTTRLKLPSGKPILIGGLERFFVRHHDGLRLIRELITDVQRFSEPVLITCSSWAWEYLQHALPGTKLLPEPKTVEAVDGPMLQEWLLALNDGRRLSVRRSKAAETGEQPVSPVLEQDLERATSELYSRLAALSRGNLGVAQAIWNRSLFVPGAVESNLEVTDEEDLIAAVEIFSPARFPDRPGRAGSLVLHELLVSNGSTISRLESSLPMQLSEIEVVLDALRATSLVSASMQTWSVSPLMYQVIRNELNTFGFTTDKF